MTGPIDLRCGMMSCRLAPALGGAVLALRHGGRPVLRSAEAAADVLATAAFPLVPFANRIAHGRFTFAGQAVTLRADPAAWPHAHHGEGWRRPWQVEAVTGDRAILALTGGTEADYGWPWRYLARQHVRLLEDGLLLELAVTNLCDGQAMPLGLGWHPYFPKSGSDALTATAAAMWRHDGSGLARAAEPNALFAAGTPVGLDRLESLDNTFVCPDPVVTLTSPDLTVTLAGEGAGFHLYTPPGQPWFCVEPVSHGPNAFGRGEFAAADSVAPGATRRQRYSLRILPTAASQGSSQ